MDDLHGLLLVDFSLCGIYTTTLNVKCSNVYSSCLLYMQLVCLYVVAATTFSPNVGNFFTNGSHFTYSVVSRWSSRPDLVSVVYVELLFVLVSLAEVAFYADIVAFLFHQCCQQVVKSMHICDTSTFSVIARDRLLLMQRPAGQHAVGNALYQGLVNVQTSKPLGLVTTTADVLDELELKEEATQLRGWLARQYFST